MTYKKRKIFTFILFVFATSILAQSQWRQHGDMPLPVAGGEAVVLQDKVYILGGSDSTGTPITAIQTFDPTAPVNSQWDVVGHLAVPRSNFVADVWDDMIIIAGGETGLDQAAVSSMEIWGPTYGSKKLADDITMNRIGASGNMWNGIFIIIGGYYQRGIGASENAIIGFNIAESNEWLSVQLPETLIPYNHASFLIGDALYLAGGVRTGVSKRIYQFSLTGHGVPRRIQPDLKQPRASFEAVVIPNEAAYFIGGYNEVNNALATTSIFHVNRLGYQLDDGPKLNSGRSALMSAVLNDTIYVFGGLDARGEIVSSVEKLALELTSAVEEKTVRSFFLKQNFPNPFNPSTTIQFELPILEHVQLEVYAADGALVRTLIDGASNAGEHSVMWDGTDAAGRAVPSGVYFYRLTTESTVETRKMLLVK